MVKPKINIVKCAAINKVSKKSTPRTKSDQVVANITASSKTEESESLNQEYTSELGWLTRLDHLFFNQQCNDLAKALLGKCLIRRYSDEGYMAARIVETEAYPGAADKVYGTLHCMNISSQGDGAAVLIRAAEPLVGLDTMTVNRQKSQKSSTKKSLKPTELCSGPSRLCQALDINKHAFNGNDLTTDTGLYVVQDGFKLEESSIKERPRIGINNYGSEAANKLYRYYINSNVHVSVI